MSSTSDKALGPLVRLRSLPISQLPSHPSLSAHQTHGPSSVTSFAASALNEAQVFSTKYLPANFTTKSSSKTSEPATAPIALLAHEINASDLPREIGDAIAEQNGPGGMTEHWFARVSEHENEKKNGTGTWEEFDWALRIDHSQHEMEYTPDVMDAHVVLDYASELGERKVEGGWEEVDVKIMEMLHHIPTPLQNRVFTVLVITARRTNEFLTVQIPVEGKHLPGAKYVCDGKVTPGIYVSIERGELVDDGKKTRWEMATASDAGGNLPMWAQKMGTPGAVVKDVGLVVKWLQERREVKGS